MRKKVLFVIIDALSSRVVNPAIEDGRLPNLAALVERGMLARESAAVFPSITPAATASLVTGEYPSAHGIAGNYWYDEDSGEVAYYGDDFWVILKEGFAKFLDDFLVRLNETRLRSQTLFEMVEASDRRAACINFLWFRGQREHKIHVPLLVRLLGRSSGERTLRGPDVLCLGDLATAIADSGEQLDDMGGGIFNRYGFNDDATAQYLLQLAKRDELPPLAVAYFPDNDYRSHEVGPAEALETVQNVDSHLGELFEASGGIDRFLEHTAVLVTGDHSQAEMHGSGGERAAGIALHETLKEFALADAGQPWGKDDQVMVCPNMRAAQLYLRPRDDQALQRQLVDVLLRDERIDQVMFREHDDAATGRIHVVTADRGRLDFAPGTSGESAATDAYGSEWQWHGDLAAIDASVGSGRTIEYGQYPNALERIAGGFSDKAGSLWITARPGYEFHLSETSVHAGGSHGSLHELDSHSPMVLAGAPAEMRPTRPFRSVDCVPLALELLGVASGPSVGEARRPG